MYRILICLCVTLAICLTACGKDDYEQAFAPLDTLDFGPPETTAIEGDADDVMGIVDEEGNGSKKLDTETE